MKDVKREVVKKFKVRWVDNSGTPATAVVSALRETQRIEFAPQQGWVAPSKNKHCSCSGTVERVLKDTMGQQNIVPRISGSS